jgi:hypothetical protein
LLSASVTRTIFSPVVIDGTVNVTAENEPDASVFSVEGVVVIRFPANVTFRLEDGAKPWPETVIVAPEGPIVGCMVMLEVTVKLAFAVYVPSRALTSCTPMAEGGTMNLTPDGIAPEEEAVVVATVVPS